MGKEAASLYIGVHLSGKEAQRNLKNVFAVAKNETREHTRVVRESAREQVRLDGLRAREAERTRREVLRSLADEERAVLRLRKVRHDMFLQEQREAAARRRMAGPTVLSNFRRGVDSTRLNLGTVSPLVASFSRAGIAGAAGTGAVVAADAMIRNFTQGVKDAAALEQELNVLGAQGRATSKDLDGLRQTARELGADLELPGVSSLEAAQAMSALVRPLGDVQAASDGARGALQLAKIENTDVAEAAKIAAGGVKAFNLEAKETTRVADVLSRIIAVTGDSLDQIAQGFAQASTSYNAAGFSIEELALDYVALSQAGVKGSDAGTSLRNAIDRLRAPTKEVSAEMKKLGIEVYRADGTMKSHREVVDSVSRALARLNPQARAAAVQTIFGADAQRAANLALGAGADKADALGKRLKDAAGAAETLAAKSKGLAGAQDAYNSALESFNEKHAAKFLNFFTEVVRSGSNVIDLLDKYIDRVSKANNLPTLNPFKTFNDAMDRQRKLESPEEQLKLVNAVRLQINQSGRVDPSLGGKLNEYLFQQNPRNAKDVLPIFHPGGFVGNGDLTELKNFLADLSVELLGKVQENARKAADAKFVADNQKRWRDSIPKPKVTTTGGGGGTGVVDTSDLQVKLIQQESELRSLQSRVARVQDALSSATTEGGVVANMKKLRGAVADVKAQEIAIAETQRALSKAQDTDSKKPKGGKVITATYNAAVAEAGRDAQASIDAAQKSAEAVRKRIKDQAKRDADEAAKKAAELSKDKSLDSLTKDLQGYERTLKATETAYDAAIKAMDETLTLEDLEAAEKRADELALQILQVSQNIARKKKEIAVKREGKSTKAIDDELAGALGPRGTLQGEYIGRLGESSASQSKNLSRISESEAQAKQALRDSEFRITDQLIQAMTEHNQGVLAELEMQLAAIPKTRKNIGQIDELLAAISRMREVVVQFTLKAALNQADDMRGELVKRINSEKDPNVKAALRKSLEDFDSREATFDEFDANGNPTGQTVTVRGANNIAKYQARRAAERQTRANQDAQKREVKDIRDALPPGTLRSIELGFAHALDEGTRIFIEGLLSGKGGAVDSFGTAIMDSLRQSLTEGLTSELRRSATRELTPIFEDLGEKLGINAGKLNLSATNLGLAAAGLYTLGNLFGAGGKKKQKSSFLGGLIGLGIGSVLPGVSLFQGFAGGAFLGGALSPRAAGGPILPGRSYVFEGHRPEILTMGADGRGWVYGSGEGATPLGGGGKFEYNHYGPVYNSSDSQANARAFVRSIEDELSMRT